MNKEFGRKFTEKREELGKTIEDMAAVTKIRTDYLKAIEHGEFEIDIPEVYLRGFVKSYAKHLRMDVDSIMAECPIPPMEVFSSSARRREMIQKIATQEQSVDNSVVEENNEKSNSNTYSYADSISMQKTYNILKMGGIVIGSIFILVTVIILILKLFSSSPSDAKILSEARQYSQNAQSRNYSITATNDVKLIIRNRDNKEKVFSGTLSAGETRTFNFKTPMQMFYDKGDSLIIKKSNGEMIYPQPGRGGIEL